MGYPIFRETTSARCPLAMFNTTFETEFKTLDLRIESLENRVANSSIAINSLLLIRLRQKLRTAIVLAMGKAASGRRLKTHFTFWAAT